MSKKLTSCCFCNKYVEQGKRHLAYPFIGICCKKCYSAVVEIAIAALNSKDNLLFNASNVEIVLDSQLSLDFLKDRIGCPFMIVNVNKTYSLIVSGHQRLFKSGSFNNEHSLNKLWTLFKLSEATGNVYGRCMLIRNDSDFIQAQHPESIISAETFKRDEY